MPRSALMLLLSALVLCILAIRSAPELPDEIDWRDCRKEWGAACDCS